MTTDCLACGCDESKHNGDQGQCVRCGCKKMVKELPDNPFDDETTSKGEKPDDDV